ncbi:hypothetical protein PsYK624_145710 [Phanerochaete sordida]|uniref:Uncharacterized protein n=1 Tax=Phanerochaete sordida TaxID=48140 RepID=A0A9P3GM56_9APHY|nr:hypothetical protein PsYK624_145710 [Phanerochaete sordida]
MRRFNAQGSSISTVLLRDGTLHFIALLCVHVLQLVSYPTEAVRNAQPITIHSPHCAPAGGLQCNDTRAHAPAAHPTFHPEPPAGHQPNRGRQLRCPALLSVLCRAGHPLRPHTRWCRRACRARPARRLQSSR